MPWLPRWVVNIVGPGLGLLIPGLIAVYLSRRTRRMQLKQALHEKRLEAYPNLVKAATPLALYFSPLENATPHATLQELKEMGVAMRTWYLEEGGGLLLSAAARDAYFILARAVTKACAVEGNLHFPASGDWLEVSQEKIQKYAAELKLPKTTLPKTMRLRKRQKARLRESVEKWTFGENPQSSVNLGGPASRFSDFVYLQRLASHLRSELAEDIEVRRTPT